MTEINATQTRVKISIDSSHAEYFVYTINYVYLGRNQTQSHKRKTTFKKHGLDFLGCDAIWDSFTITREDIRADYGEPRLVCFGTLRGEVVVLVYTERRESAHLISLRKAEKYEARYYHQIAQENPG